jgi:hypothetical protein
MSTSASHPGTIPLLGRAKPGASLAGCQGMSCAGADVIVLVLVVVFVALTVTTD